MAMQAKQFEGVIQAVESWSGVSVTVSSLTAGNDQIVTGINLPAGSSCLPGDQVIISAQGTAFATCIEDADVTAQGVLTMAIRNLTGGTTVAAGAYLFNVLILRGVNTGV